MPRRPKAPTKTPVQARNDAEQANVDAWLKAHPDWSVRNFADAWGMSVNGTFNLLQRTGHKFDFIQKVWV